MKHQVSEQKPKEEKVVWQVQVYSEYDKMHVLMTLEKSVRDVIKNWNGCDYSISKERFEESKAGQAEMIATMKRCGYMPVLNMYGKHTPISGMYRFMFVKH